MSKSVLLRLVGMLALLSAVALHGAEPNNQSADEAWIKVKAILDDRAWTSRTNEVAFIEPYRIQLRNAGWDFYKKYPDDPRILEWLSQTLNQPPRYYRDLKEGQQEKDSKRAIVAARDESARKAWDDAYREIRKKFFASPVWDARQKDSVYFQEMQMRLVEAWPRPGEDQHLIGETIILSMGVDFPDLAAPAVGVKYLAQNKQTWGFSPVSWDEFMGKLEASPNASLRKAAAHERELIAEASKPVDLKFTAMDGQAIDLSKFRGRVVLLDTWATWCSSCIEELPQLKALEQKYASQGLCIIGVCRNGEADKSKVEDFLEKQDVTWPQWFDPVATKDFSVRMGLTAVGLVLVIDQNGKPVSSGSNMKLLEAQIIKLLGTSVKDAATQPMCHRETIAKLIW